MSDQSALFPDQHGSTSNNNNNNSVGSPAHSMQTSTGQPDAEAAAVGGGGHEEVVVDEAEEDEDWETEPSEGYEDDDNDISDDGDDESEGLDIEDADDMDVFNHNPWEGYDRYDIENLTPSLRANRRPIPAMTDEEDIMSEFSGDEKYEPKPSYTSQDGEGDRDMYDICSSELYVSRTVDDSTLTYKIRQLMIKLTKGRKDRERKLRIGAYAPPPPSSPSSLSSPSRSAPESMSNKAYLHRLMVRGRNQPQEVEQSPAVSFHHQCANSLTVAPSAMGLWDDIFTIHLESVMRCGVAPRMTERTFHQRQMAAIMEEDSLDLDYGSREMHRPYAEPLKTVKATKFLRTSLYNFGTLPSSETYLPILSGEDPLCMAHRYGYVVMGAREGMLIVHCTQCQRQPIEIHNNLLAGSLHNVMLNSVQIVRWPRYYRSNVMQDDDRYEAAAGQEEDEQEDLDGEIGDDDYDEKEGYPTKPGQFDHYLIMTGNDSGLFIAALPDHPDKEEIKKQSRKYHIEYGEDDFYGHVYKYKEDHTWIRSGFGGEALNDAKASPNGRWIAVVGDSAKVWIIEVTHVAETEEQKAIREEREMMDKLETDSEYETDDSMEEIEAKLGIADQEVKGPRGEKRVREADDDWKNSSSSFKSAKPMVRPRLLHQFGQPVAMTVPDKVLFTPQQRKRRRNHERYASQYVAWNATSTKFAHSSDTSSRVVVWSMPSREIICCVDTGGLSFAIDFHPTLENLFAVANWYGFVHVVDLTGCCIGDEDLVPDDVHYNGQAKIGPGLTGKCEGPHYEEKHDILMLSFRGEKDRSLRILDAIRGLGWSTDGRHLYVSTLRRVLRYELAVDGMKIPTLFELCAREVKAWKERELNAKYTNESMKVIRQVFKPMPEEWEYVPYFVKRRIWGDMFLMRTHDQ
ncbi:hypothetical protein EDD11_006393 [Mortierella claussenii]|nr:hypothetical protein EDD11_006393 [Mortierella claussenii]